MDINYVKRYEPLFGDYYVKRKIGEGGNGAVFEITRDDFGQTYSSALKVISIPHDEELIDSMKLQGEDPSQYCYHMAESLIKEVEAMSMLKGNSNIVSYENHKTIPHEDGIGWDILIKMELLTPLFSHLQGQTISEEQIVQIGMDICQALQLCHRDGIIHRDIKPANIFCSDQGNYKLGDFGVSKVNAAAFEETRVGTLSYMAPEVFNGDKYDKTIDIYSLGLVLYTLTNGYLMPFEERSGDFASKSIAQSKRTAGLDIPKPTNASEELTAVILKACAFQPEDRFQSAEEMHRALEKCLHKDAPRPAKAASEKSKPAAKATGSQKKVAYGILGGIGGLVLIFLLVLLITPCTILGHDYTSEVTKKATCGASGIKTFSCTRCDEAYTRKIKATGDHQWSSWEKTDEDTGNGLVKERTCQVCSKVDSSTYYPDNKHLEHGDGIDKWRVYVRNGKIIFDPVKFTAYRSSDSYLTISVTSVKTGDEVYSSKKYSSCNFSDTAYMTNGLYYITSRVRNGEYTYTFDCGK